MKITNNIPKDWKDLQNKVCELLNEAGYPSESPKEINTVRGKVEDDVFSTSNDELIKQFICECKFWNTAVPKEKIHAFRTVVNDSGSMVGIFISKNGFQSGAIEAAYCSNVLLKNWDEFLEMIKNKWLIKQLPRIKKIVHPLSVYTDFLDVPVEKLTKQELKIYRKLNEKYTGVYIFCRNLKNNIFDLESIVINEIKFTACDELFEYLEEICTTGIKEYEEIFKKHPIEKWKLEAWEHMLLDL